MTYFIPLSLICIYAISFALLLKKRIEQTLPISVVTIVLIIYLCGMLDNLKLGIKIVEIMAVIQIVIILYALCKEKNNDIIKENLKKLLTPGFLIYILLSILFILINKGRIFENYDEFNHWGKIVKNMFIYNTYGTNVESTITFNEYPPFTGIFEYLFLMIKKVYSEDVIITAQCILYLSIIIPITQKIRWDKTLKRLLVIVPLMIFVPVIFFQDFYLNILVDGILGVMFGVCLFYEYKKEDVIFKYVTIFSMLIMMALTKTTGIALAILAICINIIKVIKDRKKDKIYFKLEIKSCIIIISIVTILLSIWYVKVSGAEKRWDFSQYIEKESINEIDKYKTLKNFISAIIFNQIITDKNLTFFVTFLIITCIYLYINKKLKESNKDSIYYIKSMFISTVIYIIFLYITYVKIFTTIEGENIASFSRYASTILLANVIFQMMIFIDIETEIGYRKIMILLTLIICFIPQSNIQEKYINGKNYIATENINRDIYTKILKYKSKLKQNDKILYISGRTVNIEYLKAIIEYEIMPVKISKVETGFFLSQEQFQQLVKDFDYVYVYRIDDEDADFLKNNFNNNIIKKDTLYKIDYENENLMLIEETQ